VDEVEEDNKYKNELQFNANNEALVEDIHRYSSDMLYQLDRVEEAFRANFNRVKINLMTEIDVELEKTNVIFKCIGFNINPCSSCYLSSSFV
jgi:hypothetical protein